MYIEIRLTGQLLYIKESELRLMLAQNPEIWMTALGRGKGAKRAMRTEYFNHQQRVLPETSLGDRHMKRHMDTHISGISENF